MSVKTAAETARVFTNIIGGTTSRGVDIKSAAEAARFNPKPPNAIVKAARFDATNGASAARLANTKAKILGEVFIYYFKSTSFKKRKGAHLVRL
jgi:uncharacterized lipoprotein